MPPVPGAGWLAGAAAAVCGAVQGGGARPRRGEHSGQEGRQGAAWDGVNPEVSF